MTARSLAPSSTQHWDQYLNQVLYPTVSKGYVRAYVIGLSLLYIFVYVHTPIAVYPGAPHDDGLYMSLGRYLSEGRWLGPYNQFTLMKGPGYPFFLAITNWLGISVAWAQALLHCGAVTAFVLVCHRFIKSLTLSALLFLLLLWHPVFLSIILRRIIRDSIYHAEILLFLAAFIFTLFCAVAAKARLWHAILSGGLLGWVWLTREEGPWLLPALATLVIGAYLARPHMLQELTRGLLIVVAVFVGAQAAFATKNRLQYGKFVGIDFKEPNFQRALASLHSVVSGKTQPFVSVTRETRQLIYPVSPAFASLAPFFDVPADQGWAALTCPAQPTTCGEIASGWFMWALRDAAALRGHYASPAKASAFFDQIADDITAACARGKLQCRSGLVSEMPTVTWAQLVTLPSRFVEAVNLLLLIRPPLHLSDSSGDDALLASALRFLNYPLHKPINSAATADEVYVINGWYHKSGTEWVWVTIRNAAGAVADLRFDRRKSPDIARVHPGATDQRFTMSTRCNDQCVVQLETPDGAKMEKKLAELRGRFVFPIPVGQGTFLVESVTVSPNPVSMPQRSERVSERIRLFALTYYRFIFVPVLILGLSAFLVTTAMYWRGVLWNVCYVLALTSWVLVLARMSLLVLIDATSMPVLHGVYHTPAFSFLVCGAVLSIAAWVQVSGHGQDFARPRQPP